MRWKKVCGYLDPFLEGPEVVISAMILVSIISFLLYSVDWWFLEHKTAALYAIVYSISWPREILYYENLPCLSLPSSLLSGDGEYKRLPTCSNLLICFFTKNWTRTGPLSLNNRGMLFQSQCFPCIDGCGIRVAVPVVILASLGIWIPVYTHVYGTTPAITIGWSFWWPYYLVAILWVSKWIFDQLA